MRFKKQYSPSLEGTLLIAHPAMGNPTFRKSVILISAHSKKTGSVGIVINHPLEQTMGEFSEQFAYSALSKVPLYLGGPMDKQAIILTAWQWIEEAHTFRFHFGITEKMANDILNNNPNIKIRAYMGYAGWGHGQLEAELEQQAWLISSINNLVFEPENFNIWRKMVAKVQPELVFLADFPEDLSAN